jgi:ankyrin repeat protein
MVMEIDPSQYLIAACADGASRVIQLLLNTGADPNSRDQRHTALGLASAKGKVDIIRQLLEHHADINLQDASLKTPLHHACSSKYRGALSVLLEAGADVHITDNEGNYPIHIAFENEHLLYIQKLLPLYDINLKNGNGNTFLYLAFDVHSYIWEHILRSGADPNLANNNGEVPLHRAVQKRNLKQVELLLNAGADPLIKNRHGQTPRDLAIRESLTEIANILELAEGLNVIKEPDES